MIKRIAKLAGLIPLIAVGGCVLALPLYNKPFEERLILVSESPSAYKVVIDESDLEPIEVPADGRLLLRFPVLPRECSTYLLGVRIRDRSVESRKLIHFVRNGIVVRRMSVKQLRRRPMDPLGYHRVRLR